MSFWCLRPFHHGRLRRRHISLLVMVGTVALAATGRQLALADLYYRNPQLYSFIQELSGAFQICACTHELRLLADFAPCRKWPSPSPTPARLFTA
uniref:Uncharacterized protein n=1 Tax=Sphaerodactylus townsendi TaxID=933632 RepID=A0ACB8FG32_9SAUR